MPGYRAITSRTQEHGAGLAPHGDDDWTASGLHSVDAKGIVGAGASNDSGAEMQNPDLERSGLATGRAGENHRVVA